MNIVVIDNTNWLEQGACFKDNKPFDFINTSLKTFEDILSDLKSYQDFFEDIVYFINLHCVFLTGNSKKKRTINYQEQNGIIIYRQLLKLYEHRETDLKVVFFSPIVKEDLIKLKPENIVLKHHIVLTIPFSWDKCIAEIKEKSDWAIFNNASESLLSGWSLLGRIPINTNGKNIVFIDDQTPEWIITYKQIVDNNKTICFFTYNRNEAPIGEFSPTKIQSTEFKTKAHQADLIISDLYLEENHDTNKWMSVADLENISGYRMYKYIKNELNSGIPMIIHTSSNKVRYFQFLERNGLDDWASKDVRVDISNSEKQYNFVSIQNTIEKFTAGKNASIYEDLKNIWKRIEKLKNTSTQNWWYLHTDVAIEPKYGMRKLNKTTRIYLIEILTDAYFALRTYLKREDLLADELNSKDVNFSASAIASNLGKIFELLGFKQNEMDSYGYNLHLRFFFNVRNAASHYASYKYFSIEDTIIYFYYWLLAFEDNEQNVMTKFRIDGQAYIYYPDHSEFGLFYTWIQFYNSTNRPLSNQDKLSSRIKNRMDSLLNFIDHNKMFNELSNEGQTRSQVILNWNPQGQIFKLVPEGYRGKLKLSNA